LESLWSEKGSMIKVGSASLYSLLALPAQKALVPACSARIAPDRTDLMMESLAFVVGVVQQPQLRFLNGENVWLCQLCVTDVGKSAAGTHLVAAQQQVRLTCVGLRFSEYCSTNLGERSLVHVSARLFHRPKYVAMHGTYTYETMLEVSDQCGDVALIKT